MKQNILVTLPKDLLNKVEELKLSKIDRDFSIKFIDNLMKRSFRKFGTVDSLVETPYKYIEKITHRRYLSWLNKLIDKNIIICNNSYSNINNNIYSKSYSIYNITPTPIMTPTFNKTDCITTSYLSKKQVMTTEQIEIKNMVIEDFKQLDFNYKAMTDILDKVLEDTVIDGFKINSEVTKDVMQVTFREGRKEKKEWMNKTTALRKAAEDRTLLIQDDHSFYLMDEAEFILKKKLALYISYKDAITKFDKKIFFASRNTRNNRLDSNITNMSNLLTDELCKQNNLVKFDLCNAQFAILSSIIGDELKTEDFNSFKNHSYSGTLYEYVKDELTLPSRGCAKKSMFELMFSKETLVSQDKNKLKQIFPSVVELVDAYKKEHGYAEFSVMLQKKESEIFIDGLWKMFKNKKMFCLTKHDCLIFKKADEEKAVKMIQQYFTKIKFKGKIIKE